VILLGRDRTRTFDGVTYVVVQEPLTRTHQRLLNRHHAVQIDETAPPVRDLGWLTPWADTLERILVTDYSVTDISALESLTGLEVIELYTGKLTGQKNRIRYENFPGLRVFGAHWYATLDGIFQSPTVEDLLLERPPADVLVRSAGMPSLRKLDLRGANKVVEVPRLANPSSVQHLKVTMGRFTDVAGLASYPNIEILELDDVRGVQDLSSLRAMPRLRRLVLEDCGEIGTLSWLADLPIEEFFLIGTTNILDGDLRSIGTGLRAASFPNRPHYNATPADLK
jgi:hypothetical protein